MSIQSIQEQINKLQEQLNNLTKHNIISEIKTLLASNPIDDVLLELIKRPNSEELVECILKNVEFADYYYIDNNMPTIELTPELLQWFSAHKNVSVHLNKKFSVDFVELYKTTNKDLINNVIKHCITREDSEYVLLNKLNLKQVEFIFMSKYMTINNFQVQDDILAFNLDPSVFQYLVSIGLRLCISGQQFKTLFKHNLNYSSVLKNMKEALDTRIIDFDKSVDYGKILKSNNIDLSYVINVLVN